jgi:hypothetical protein
VIRKAHYQQPQTPSLAQPRTSRGDTSAFLLFHSLLSHEHRRVIAVFSEAQHCLPHVIPNGGLAR